jgi:hypothetical protein
MNAIIAITNRDGCNEHLHPEAPKCSRDEPLKCNEEGRGNQPQSHKVALPTNVIRALWGRCEYHNNTHPTSTIIAARVSIAAMRVQWTQTAMFLPTSAGVKGCTLNATMATIVTVSMAGASSTSSTMVGVAAMTSTTTRRVSPSARTRASSPDAYRVSMPITCTASAMLIRATKHTNNNNLQPTTTKTQPPQNVHHTSCARQLLDKQQSKLPGRASDTIFSDKRTSASNENKK